MFLEATVFMYWNASMKFNAGFLLQTRQTTFSPNEKLPAATFFLRASMLGTIDSLLSVMLCYSKYGATGMKGTRRGPSVVLPTWQVSYYVETLGPMSVCE